MNGVLVIDKPSGWTSHDVVAKIRNLTKIKKVGHTGTLDPFATGVLALTLGRATRLTEHFLLSDKVYLGVMRFGFATTTYDLEGEALSEDLRPSLDIHRLRDIAAKYSGTIRQTIPPYSAKKVRGKPLYAYSRQGIPMESSTKEVKIKSFQLLSVEGQDVEFELECTAGTYARSLAHEFGQVYGCGAHLARLRRTRSGEFSIETATPLAHGDETYPGEFFLSRIIPMGELLKQIPAIVLSAGEKNKLIHGMDLNVLTTDWDAAEYRILDESGDLVALARRLQTFPSPAEQPVRWVRVHPRMILV